MNHKTSLLLVAILTAIGLSGLYMIKKASQGKHNTVLLLSAAAVASIISMFIVYFLFKREHGSMTLLNGIWSAAYIVGGVLISCVLFEERPPINVWIGVALSGLALLFLLDVFCLNKNVK